MPLPSRKDSQNKNDFMQQCMGDPKMKKEFTETKQRLAVCVRQSQASDDMLVERVCDQLYYMSACWDEEWNEFTQDVILAGVEVIDEKGKSLGAEYQGRKVTLNKPFLTPKGPKKRSVYVKNEKGNVVKVNFGDPNMRIKKSDPARRKSFRARHNCDNPGPRTKARYWSCRKW